MSEIVPTNSRYVPFTQQPACCVPTCFQMIMYRHQIPLKPAEEIGFELGLVVHPDRKNLFYNVRVSEQKPSAGYGTRIYDPEFEPNAAFRRMKIPLLFSKKPITEIQSGEELLSYLKNAEDKDQDILLCFNHGALINDESKDWGHVCVFDRVVNSKIRMIDPSPDQPKWKMVDPLEIYNSMLQHGEKRSAGCWEISLNR